MRRRRIILPSGPRWLRNDWAKFDGPPLTRPGVLPDDVAPGTLCGFASDRIKIVPKTDRLDLIQERRDANLTFRKCVLDVLDQNGNGSCASEEAVQACHTMTVFSGGRRKHTLLSPLSVYPFVNGGRDAGSGIGANWSRMRSHGALPMEVWPRSNGHRKKPSQELFDEYGCRHRIDEFWQIRNAEEFISALLLGYVVGYGRRGHAILAIEMLDHNKFLYSNSWGPWTDGESGFKGFGVDDVRRDIQWGYGAFAARTTVDPGGPRGPKRLSATEPQYEINLGEAT